jgi:hypothetical protein
MAQALRLCYGWLHDASTLDPSWPPRIDPSRMEPGRRRSLMLGEIARCEGFRKSPFALLPQAQVLNRQALEAGSMVAQASGLASSIGADSGKAAAIATNLLASRDAAVFDALWLYFISSRAHERLKGIATPRVKPLFLAWHAFACRAPQNCAPGSPFERDRCLYQGLCANAGVEEDLRVENDARDYREIMDFRRFLQEVVVTGRWDRLGIGGKGQESMLGR